MVRNMMEKLLLIAVSLLVSTTTVAAEATGPNPEAMGQYSVGYTKFHACDDQRVSLVSDDAIFHSGTLRDCVRGPVMGGKILVARPVSFHVWYPSLIREGLRAQYTVNNDVYPNVGLMKSAVSLPSPHGALFDVAVAKQPLGFPLIIFSPGYSASGAQYANTFNEILASRGFILAALDHTGDYYPSKINELESGLYSYPVSGPFPTAANDPSIVLIPRLGDFNFLPRIYDVKFAIDEMIRRYHNTINENKIGLQSYSFGGPTILAVAGGLASEGIPADPRVKALMKFDGSIYGNINKPAESKYFFDFATPTRDDLINIKIPVLLMTNDNDPDSIRAFKDLGSQDVTLVELATPSHISTAFSLCTRIEILLNNFTRATSLDLFIIQFINKKGFSDNVYMNCPANLFTEHPDYLRHALWFGDASLDIPPPPLGLAVAPDNTPSIYTMPLQMLDSALLQIEGFYSVAFFESTLADRSEYRPFLNPSYAQKNLPLFVKTWQNEYKINDHPLDLHSGDKITFLPKGDNLYEVSLSHDNQMIPVDNTFTSLSKKLQFVPFRSGFPFLGTIFGNSKTISPFLTSWFHDNKIHYINNISVSSHGDITLGMDLPEKLVGNRNEVMHSDNILIGGGVYRIAPFFADIINGKLLSKETTDGRLILTWLDAEKYPYYLEDYNIGSAQKTGRSSFQVILYGNTSKTPGKIEFIYGHLDPFTNSPEGIIATVGIAKGNAWTNYPIVPIGDKMGTKVHFSQLLNHPITAPLGTIYEVFTRGIDIKK